MAEWGLHPKKMDYHGQAIEVFRRGDLASALNRKVVTIRSMEQSGVLCHPRLKDGRGHWLYTRDQILDLATLAVEEEVIEPSYRRTFSPRFIEEAHKILTRLPA